jgi:transcription antitermination factor NusG
LQLAPEISTVIAAVTPKWFAVHTVSNHERTVARQFQDRSIPFFLPTYKMISRWSDRKKELDVPLFAGYVFVHIALESRIQVLHVPSVLRLVGTQQGPSEVSKEEIESLQQAMVNRSQVAPHDYVKAGDPVQVVRGPFAGMTGRLTRIENQHRVVIMLDSIHQAFSVRVEISDVEALGVKHVR